MNTAVKNVAIIGAGLGGLACAIALRKQGFKVQVYFMYVQTINEQICLQFSE